MCMCVYMCVYACVCACMGLSDVYCGFVPVCLCMCVFLTHAHSCTLLHTGMLMSGMVRHRLHVPSHCVLLLLLFTGKMLHTQQLQQQILQQQIHQVVVMIMSMLKHYSTVRQLH